MPVSEITKRILPWTVLGFVVMVISGALLFLIGVVVRPWATVQPPPLPLHGNVRGAKYYH